MKKFSGLARSLNYRCHQSNWVDRAALGHGAVDVAVVLASTGFTLPKALRRSFTTSVLERRPLGP
jgi:hypothetical protein